MKQSSNTEENQKNVTASKDGRRRRKLEHWQVISIYLMLFDVLAVNLCYFATLWLRFDLHFSEIPGYYITAWLHFVPVYTVFCLIVFYMLHLYNSIWRFASYTELNRVMISSVITAAFHAIAITILEERMPISYYVFGALLQFMAVLGIRFSYRFVLLTWKNKRRSADSKNEPSPRIMLIGAGIGGQMLLRDITRAPEINGKVVCIIDDNPNKWNRYIEGVPVVGGRESIPENVKKYQVDKIYFAIPTAKASQKKEILDICKDTGCELKTVPGMYQLVNGEVSVKTMKDVNLEDLLGRDPVSLDMTEVFSYIQGKVIMVTGGGGSIGSELCRQIAGHAPKQLIIFDIYENNAFQIQQELKRTYPDLDLVALIGSVRDSSTLIRVFEQYHPDVVYHAAAHKHVPLMEDAPREAIKNNVLGTYKTAYAAMLTGCSRFVLISTDKAVNPTNIMGASKRLCEMIVQTFDHMVKLGRADELPFLSAHGRETDREVRARMKDGEKPHTQFVAVRFGNVLGSNGSVIPLFRKQIAEGGPVTVTHPDIIRYFMTIPEAVSLVLQASVMGQGSEIFVLDMGSPMKIDTLARNLIRLSGFRPDEDIKIVYTGLRPGEKLYEEKLMAEEGLKTTPNHLIHIGMPVEFDYEKFPRQLEMLLKACYKNDGDIRKLTKEIVSTYHPEKAGG